MASQFYQKYSGLFEASAPLGGHQTKDLYQV